MLLQHLTVVISDANLQRYSITPKDISEALTGEHTRVQDGETSCRRVHAVIIFIASFGDEATNMVDQLPRGHAFMCLDVSRLPQTLQEVFTTVT